MAIPPMDRLNLLPRTEFLTVVNTLFETAPPLADYLFNKRPFKSYEKLIETAEYACCVDKTIFNETQRIEIINAHPRIGASKSLLSAMSLKEQGYTKPVNDAKEDEEVNKKLQLLNDEYEKKFGFKFVVFVNGRSRKEVIPVLERRMQGEAMEELDTGLREMMEIAKDRLKKF